MSTRWQNNQYVKHRTPSFYMRNRVYPDARARTEWQTRTSRRMHDGLVLNQNYGLDTVSDDVNSSPYSSPYYVNGRYNSDNLVTQRGSSASVQGTKPLLRLKDRVEDFSENDVQTSLELWQGKQIKFTLSYSGKIVGNTITVRNTDGCTGKLSFYLSETDGGAPIYETTIDLNKVSRDHFEHYTLYSNLAIPAGLTLDNKLYARLEIWDEISEKRSVNPFNTGRKIEIAATGLDNHYACTYRLGEKNVSQADDYNYSLFPSRPLVGLIYNDYVSVPVDKTENEKTGATASLNGFKYDIFCIKDATHAEIVIYDRANNVVLPSDIRVDSRTTQVNIAQCTDTNFTTWVYYVDGYSKLQKFKIGEWISSVVPQNDDPDDDTQPVTGASIIVNHNNRLYLAGFTHDPNLVQISRITADGVDWEVMPYRIYTPNRSPYDTSTNPIKAIVEYATDQLLIVGDHFASLFQSNVNIEDGSPTQVSMYTDAIGVKSQGDICNYKGVVYSFDPEEGIRRYTGATWSVLPNSIDSHFDRVDMSKPRKLWGYANKLYFNYTDKVDGKAKCLIWDQQMNYQQYPWFQDVDVPFCDVRFDHDFDLIGIHPDFPCIMQLYAEDTWARLDTPIVFERHTKYIQLPGNIYDMILKRVHNEVLANADRWWWFGLTVDQPKLTQYRGKDFWFRVPCWNTLLDEEPVESPFPQQDIYERSAVARLTLSHLNARAISVQEKIKTKTFNKQASLISTAFEAQARQMN